MAITKEQFMEWKENPVTKELFTDIKLLKAELTAQLVLGDTIRASADATHGLTNRLVGQIAGLDQFLGLKFDDE